ncbi:hypothetical protein QAD02_002068 [Eretmocerus hayati]|uniref:Uncharacterized protein n=1 Tax=Eretmocerus hayati TaxID=131215 RepID=A0ACC2NHU2_9HYME|nr:hypothetical protein QAD02_002068 [Eretmocerus hayati]
MTSDSKHIFGFELLYKVSGGNINKKEDVLVLLVHWNFIKDGFKCLGIGDSKTVGPNEVGSEALPYGWNESTNYTLRYIKGGKLYILMSLRSDADLLFNLLRIEDHKVTNVQFPVETVRELQGPIDSLIPNYQAVLDVIQKDLIEPVYSRSGHEVSTQTSSSQSDRPNRDDDDPLRVRSPHTPASSDRPGILHPYPFGIGQGDLNPLGQGQGGMLFDPFSNRSRPYPGLGVPGRLPPGAVPPGARFDPFGPPDVNPPIPRARAPDTDHLPPPGYDDMFM